MARKKTTRKAAAKATKPGTGARKRAPAKKRATKKRGNPDATSLFLDPVGTTAGEFAKIASKASKGIPGGKRKAKRKNPSRAEDLAADRFEYFHGKEPETVTEFNIPVYEPSVTSGIGKLEKLVILAADGQHEVTLSGFRGALLSQSVEGNQLYIDGGDQRVNLKDFGITRPHVQELLGAVKEVWYQTDKTHLGKDGGDAIYHHTFGGRGSRLPVMIYDVRNKRLHFAGGGYDLPREGIRG